MTIVYELKIKKASYLHRTATTTYPCYLPALGDSAGAGRIRLAAAKIRDFDLAVNYEL
jgi:hypothetical protein